MQHYFWLILGFDIYNTKDYEELLIGMSESEDNQYGDLTAPNWDLETFKEVIFLQPANIDLASSTLEVSNLLTSSFSTELQPWNKQAKVVAFDVFHFETSNPSNFTQF